MSFVASESAHSQYLEVNGARIAHRCFGLTAGVPLVLCQRFRGTMDHWDPALLNTLARERPVVLFDNVGVGLSSGEAANDIAGMAQAAAAFIDKLGLPQVDLLGWSLGGAVCQQLALNRPGLIRRLILAGTGPGGVADAPRAPDKVWQVAGKPVNGDEDFLYLFFTEDDTSRQAGLASLRRLDIRLTASKSGVKPETVKAQFALYPKAGHGFLFQYPELFGRHLLEFLR